MFCELRVKPDQFPDPAYDPVPADTLLQAAVFGGGCFWCVEAVFKSLQGVQSVTSGYAGGTAQTANYHAVCGGMTDHAEVIRIEYQPAQIRYGQLLKIFFSIAHDPTQLNRQGNDQGRQYRSAVFYADEEQKRVAESYIRQLNEAQVFDRPIMTTLEPLTAFYPAEAFHQDYAARNPGQPYIAAIAQPKVEKLQQYFGARLKR